MSPAEIVFADRGPEKRLGLEPRVASDADVGQALHELAWLESRRLTIEAAAAQCERLIRHTAERELRTAREHFAAALLTGVDGSSVPIVDRERKLREAIAAYARNHRAQFVRDGRKSRVFSHGSVGFRAYKAFLQALVSDDDILATVRERHLGNGLTLVGWLCGILKTAVCYGSVPLSWLVRPKVEVNRTEINKRWEAGELQDETVADLGFEIVPAGEDVWVEVHPLKLSAEGPG